MREEINKEILFEKRIFFLPETPLFVVFEKEEADDVWKDFKNLKGKMSFFERKTMF